MGVVYTKDISVNRPADLGPSPWQLSGLLPITIVFGKNGCGKSRLLRNWRDTAPDTIHYVAPERSGELNYNANLLHAQLEGKLRQGEATRNLVGNYREQIVSRIQGYFTTRGSVRGTTVSGDPAELERFLATLLPDFQVDLKGAKNPPYQLRRSSGAAAVGNIDQLSSGEAQILTVGLDVLTIAAIWDLEGRETRIVLVDEPDAHIHPDLQVRFADFLVAVAERFKLQIVIATHSTTLLAGVAQFSGLKGGVIYLDRTRSTFKTEPFTKYKKEISACLGGHELMGPLFGVPLLLVEGDDDYRIWSQVPRHHKISLAVIPCSGDEIDQYQKNLEQLFASLRDDTSKPAGFALIDGDKALPDPANAWSRLRHFVRTHGREFREADRRTRRCEHVAS